MTYPIEAGAKDEVGQLNAIQISRSSKRLATQVAAMVLIAENPGLFSADDIARQVGISILYVRPRISELRALGIIDSERLTKSKHSNLSVNTWAMTSRALQEVDARLGSGSMESVMLDVLRHFELEFENKI